MGDTTITFDETVAAPKPLPTQKTPFACILRPRARYSHVDVTYCKREPAGDEFTISSQGAEHALIAFGNDRRPPNAFYVCVECEDWFHRENAPAAETR